MSVAADTIFEKETIVRTLVQNVTDEEEERQEKRVDEAVNQVLYFPSVAPKRSPGTA